MDSTERYLGTLVPPEGFPGLPSDWEVETKEIRSADDRVSLFSVHFYKKNSTQNRVLFVIHGQGEHSGRYLHFPHYLDGEIDHVYSYDLRGHGRSEGLRGHVEENFDQYVDDTASVLEMIYEERMKDGTPPQFHVLGHSMGGLILLRLLFRKTSVPLQSVCISAPLLGLGFEVPWIKRFAARTIGALWGSLQLSSGLKRELLSHDPAVVKAHKKDRLNHDRATPLFFISLLDAMEETLVQAKEKKELGVPALFFHPLHDEIVSPERTQALYDALSLGEKKKVELPGYFHEGFNEGCAVGVDKDYVFKELREWIASHQIQNKKND